MDDEGTETVKALRPSELGPGVLLGEDVEIGSAVSFGANAIVYSGTRIEAGVAVGDGAIVGKPPHLHDHSMTPRGELGGTVLEKGSAVLAGAIVFAGTRIGSDTIVGDQAHVRERVSIGKKTVIGRGSAVDNDVRIGERVRIQTGCYVTAFTEVDNDVFVGPGVTTSNDHTMARLPPDAELVGPRLRRACRIGASAVICPAVEVGEEAFVAAGAVVVADVPARAVVMGVPARKIREVPEQDLLERWR